MFTTCPECGTVFRVTTAQLRMAEGFVRCGHCAAEFNAIASLSDELPTPAAPPPAASGWTGRYPAATGTFAAPAAAAGPASTTHRAPAPQPTGADGAAWRDGWADRGGAAPAGLDEAGEADDADAPDDLDAELDTDLDADLDEGLVAGLDVALPAGDDGDDDEPGGVYVIEGETPEWTARAEAEEPVLARAVAPVFGTPATSPPALVPADGDGDGDAASTRVTAASRGDDTASRDADEDAAGDAAAWSAGDVEDDDDGEDDVNDDDDADDASDGDAEEESPANAEAIVLATESDSDSDSDGDIDWEALLGEVDDDEPAAPVYVVEGDAPPMARDLVDPAGDDAELDAALEAIDAEVGVADATVMAAALAADDGPTAGPATDATPDDADSTADFPVLRIPPEFRRDLAAGLPADDDDGNGDASAADAPPATGPAETESRPPAIDDDDAGPVVMLADEPPRPAAADDDWPRFDPANPPWDPPPDNRPAERPASVAELQPLWPDRPAWPQATEEPAGRRWPWAVGSLVLALALGGQVLVQQRDDLATHPEYGPRIRAAFEAVGLSVYPAWNLSAYTVRGSEAVAGRTVPGALDVIANIAVTGNEPVGLPIVRVTLRDRWNEAIGTRAFSARDYLEPASTLRDPLPPGTLIPVRVRIADPGTEAFGYEVDVCLMDRRTGLTCQAGREPFRP